MTIGKLVVVISSLVVLGIIAAFIFSFSSASEDARIDSLCSAEVAKANLLTKATSEKSISSASCDRNSVEKLSLSSNADTAEVELARFVTAEIDRCWSRMGAGKLNPFPGEKVIQVPHCYVCREFSVATSANVPHLDLQYYDQKRDDSGPLTNAFKAFREYDLTEAIMTKEKGNAVLVDQNGNEAPFESDMHAIQMKKITVDNNLVVGDKVKSSFVPLKVKPDTQYYIVNGYVSNKDGRIPLHKFNVLSYIYVVEKDELLATCRVPEN